MQCIVLIMLFLGCAAIGTAQDTPCAMVRGIIKLSPYLGDRCKEPLYVIDGKVYCCCNKRFTRRRKRCMRWLRSIKAEDITLLEVLKDSIARATYDTAARHGAIVITTKRNERK